MAFNRRSKDGARARLSELVDLYRPQHDAVTAPNSPFTETEARVGFIDEFLIALGWDVRNQEGKPQFHRDVVMERVGSDQSGVWGRPDYQFRVAGVDRLPVEAKRPSVRLGASPNASLQARSYGWSLSVPASVLTNFAETVIYDSTIAPASTDSADVAVIPGCRFSFEDYVGRFDEVWARLSYESVASDAFYSVYSYSAPVRGTSTFDTELLKEFRKWRLLLASDIAKNNTSMNAPEVGRRAQRILNALLFLRVCEDRNINKYQELLESASRSTILQHFKHADAVFNAGIFRALEGITVDPMTLLQVIQAMYWPQTQFAFAVLRPETLASLYEQYLSERVQIDSARVARLEAKPELTHAGGVIPTPLDIVQELNSSALDPLLTAGVPSDLRVLDLSTGSGTFLLDAFNRLVTATELLGKPVDLSARGIIASTHLFGVDIDGAAAEVTKLSLLLAVLGDDYVETSTARSVLPNLDHNIVTGNSVVRDDFDTILPIAAASAPRRAEVVPTSLRLAFGTKYPNSGFSAIVGNPPYVRIQVLSEFLPDQLAYLQDPRSGYDAPQSNNFDLSLVFLERAIGLLAPTGRLAMIVPHRFTNHLSGSGVRKALGERLERLVHFGEEQVFPGRSTYTGLVIAGAKTHAPAMLDLVTDLSAWREKRLATHVSMDRATLTPAAWPVATADQTRVFAQLEGNAIAHLGDPGWVHVFVGVQTSADPLYFISPTSSDLNNYSPVVTFTDSNGVSRGIERAILRPAVKDQRIGFFDGQPVPDRWAIFPYRIEVTDAGKRKAMLLSPDELRTMYPLAAAYFDAHKDYLINGRNVAPDPGPSYWAYGRSQSLAKLDEPKLIARVLSLSPQYAEDHHGFVVPGGGDGGPYYLLRPRPDCPYSLRVIQAIVSHPIVDLFVAVNGKKYRGSYAAHRKKFLVQVPVPSLTSVQTSAIEDMVGELQRIAVSLRSESDTQMLQSLRGRRTFLADSISALLTTAYGLDPDLVARVLG